MIAGRSTASIAVEGAVYGFAFALGWMAAMLVVGIVAAP
jgi:sulfite exporter TauE/SafE